MTAVLTRASLTLAFALCLGGCSRAVARGSDAGARVPVAVLAATAALTAPTPAPTLAPDDEDDGPDEPAPSPTASAPRVPPMQCHGWRGNRQIDRTLRSCRQREVDEVMRWNPDALVVLGGGVLSSGDPNCATAQRGFSAWQIFESMHRQTTVILSGRGGAREAQRLDDASVRCLRARAESTLGPRPTRTAQRRVQTESDRVARERRAMVTEADLMCAVMLRRAPPAEWDSVVSRLQFETRSMSTDQNAQFTAPMLARDHRARVLVVTSPVLKRHNRGVDDHAERAINDFRQHRGAGTWELGTIGCPTYSGFLTTLEIEHRDVPRGPTRLAARATRSTGRSARP